MPVKTIAARQAQNNHELSRANRIVNITGIVVYADPSRLEAVRAAIQAIDGAEVHAAADDGRMVVTVERADDGAAMQALEAVARADGVLSTALVYHHDEALNEEPNR